MMGAKTLEAQITDGKAKIRGDVSVLAKLISTVATAILIRPVATLRVPRCG